jgi:hypothetical protein
MFRSSLCPSSGSYQLQQQPLVLPLERGGSSAVGRGLAGRSISASERPVAARLLRSWVRIPPEAWIFVCCECSVLSGRGLCDELITRPEEFYRLCCVVECDLETSRIGAPYTYDISILRVKHNCYPKLSKTLFLFSLHSTVR